MDHHLQQLRRQACQGDEMASLRLAYAECRVGEHILRDDQIIIDPDIYKANNDVGGCQCGKKIFQAHELCQAGHHRIHYSHYYGGLAYWCLRLRPGVDIFSIACGIDETSHNPIAGGMGCDYHLQGDDACKRGLHFFQIREGAKICLNPNCDYVKPINCKRHQLSRNDYTPRCFNCHQIFTGLEICQAGQHFPDRLAGELCIREGCPLFKGGMNLYDAIAACYKSTGKLEAICRVNNKTIATANGWNEKLKALGVKKPRLSAEDRKAKQRYWGKFTNPSSIYRLLVTYTERAPRQRQSWEQEGPSWRSITRKIDYTKASKKLKTLWAKNWYPAPLTNKK